MTKHILCAVDLTHEADAKTILAEAGRLADFYGADLGVMTVIPDFGSSWVGTFFKDGMLGEAAESANTSLHNLVASVLPDRQVQHIVEIGVVYEKVLDAIASTGADLAIVGAHKPDLADKVLGPNSARIVRAAPISVLVLRI